VNASDSSPLVVEQQGEVVHLILNRPDKRNALSLELLRQIDAAQAKLREDRTVRAVVLAARGPVFCAGHDLGEMIADSRENYLNLFTLCSQVMHQFRRVPQPVIARVQGMATAAGCQLVAACDLAVAAEGATFATPGVKIGLFCTTPAVPLVRTIAPRAAMEMLLTGKPISAQRALELCLVNRVTAADGLDAAVREFTEAILSASPVTVKMGKAAFYDQLALDEESAYERATEVMAENASCSDAQEGMQAFLQKRRPIWSGK
jgi:enoyl-CoA hydratase/carnithine racemase